MIITVGSEVKDKDGNVYRLVDELGHGGFGCVYRAIREIDQSEYAVKTLMHSFASEEEARSFKNEIKLSAKVQGNNVIRYIYAHDGEEFPELPPYIIMEYAEGGTLADVIGERKKNDSQFTRNELLTLYKQLVDGMSTVNKVLVHRDIKPENILISNDTLKISDFGLAKVAAETTRTKSFKGYGSIKYYAPEAWKSEKNTIQMDIYAMGIIFYELATFEYPYSIESDNPESIRNAHLYSRVKKVDALKQAVGPGIASLIMTMLEKPTQKRFKNWEEVTQQIENSAFEPNDNVSCVVSIAIGKKLDEDSKKQQFIEETQKAQKEREDFCNLVKVQFEETIVSFFEKFVEQYNSQLSGQDKCKFESYHGMGYSTKLIYKLSIPSVTDIIIDCKVILPNSEKRCDNIAHAYGYSGDYSRGSRTYFYTPQYKGKDIMGWVTIENSGGLGYNLWLVKSQDLYGDWYILDNKNNGIYATRERPKKEPFAFGPDALQEALEGINAFSFFKSEVTPFDEEKFASFIGNIIR